MEGVKVALQSRLAASYYCLMHLSYGMSFVAYNYGQ